MCDPSLLSRIHRVSDVEVAENNGMLHCRKCPLRCHVMNLLIFTGLPSAVTAPLIQNPSRHEGSPIRWQLFQGMCSFVLSDGNSAAGSNAITVS